MTKKSELLLPAGSLKKLKTAILYGADAVYAGTPDMSLRTKASFTVEELKEGIQFVHEHGKKIYLTLNLYTHNKDIEKLPAYVDALKDYNPDGVIIADPGVFNYVKKHAPHLNLHVSTQANICSHLTVDFWKEQGAELCVLAREVNFNEFKEIREKCPDVKLETFMHGAMCMTYSGRCLLSNYMAERGANQGNCAHSCRWHYKLNIKMKDGTIKPLEITEENKELFDFCLEEGMRPGEAYEIVEDEKGSYIMNSKDLCLMPVLDELLDAGVDSLKVEGRNKSEYYAGVVARAYRQAIDDYEKDPKSWKFNKYMAELFTLQSRGYTLGFHEGRLTNFGQNYNHTRTVGEWFFAGSVVDWEDDDMIFEIRNTIEKGDVIEFLVPNSLKAIRLRFENFVDAINGDVTEKVSAGQGKRIRIPASVFENTMTIEEVKASFPVLTIARKQDDLTEENSDKLDKNITGFENELKVTAGKITKTTRDGKKLCCGKGCNGCAIFWHSPDYAEAREKLLSSKK